MAYMLVFDQNGVPLPYPGYLSQSLEVDGSYLAFKLKVDKILKRGSTENPG